MTKNSYWLRSGMYTVLMRICSMLFGLGSFYFLARGLDKGDFGAWALFLMVTSLVEVSRNALIQNALVKHILSSEAEEHPRIQTASLTINVLLSLGSILLLCLAAGFLSVLWEAPALQFMLIFYSLTTLILIPFSHGEFIHQANFDFKGVFWGHFFRLGGLFVYVAFLFFTGREILLTHLVVAHSAASLLGAVVLFAFSRRYFSFSKKIDWDWVKKLFHYGKYVFGTGVSAMILNSIDSWMLGALALGGKAAVATYTTALKISNLVEVPTSAIAAMVFPQSAKLLATEGKDAARRLYEKSVGALLAMIVPGIIFVLLIPGPLIQLIAGDQYLDAVPILQVTMLYGLFMPFNRQFGIILDSIGRPEVNFRFILFGALLNLVLNYFFIKQFDVIGAAYGTLTTYVVTFVGTQILLNRILGVKTLNAIRQAGNFYPLSFSMVMSQYRKYRGKSEAVHSSP